MTDKRRNARPIETAKAIGLARAIMASALLVLCSPMPSSAQSVGASNGRQQLVDALDAAYVRALDSGAVRKMAVDTGMGDIKIMIADCLPSPHVVPYPENPEGVLKRILDDEKIRVGRSTGSNDPGATAYFFGTRGGGVLKLVLEELASHYGTGPIEVEHVTIEPPFSNMSVLNSGDVDIIGTVNALGGETDDLRRRTSQRFTCTMSATRQIIWVLKEGGPGWTTVDDAYADEDARFCVGPLSNQITNAFFDGPGQNVYTEFGRDLDVCLAQLINGEVDAMVSPFPVDRYFPEMVDTTGDGERNASTVGLLRPIDTNFVAGTPLWIAID